MAIENEIVYNCLNADLYYQAKSKSFKNTDDLKKFAIKSFFNDRFSGEFQPDLFSSAAWTNPINLFNRWQRYTETNTKLTRYFIETIARAV